MIEPGTALAAALGGYVLGSIPFGLVLARLAGYGDIRKTGSGNIGATNVLRAGSAPLALAALILDSGKGATSVLLARALLEDGSGAVAILAGLWAVIGHDFPIWLRLKGGKGVATTLGALTALAWPVGLAACATWLLAAAACRYASLAALIALAAAPGYALLIPQHSPNPALAAGAGFLAVLAWIRHHANIRRLLRSEEPTIGAQRRRKT